MNEQDETGLRHMLDAARAAQQFAAGRNRDMLETDLMFAFALLKAIEIIGEAAMKVSEEGQTAHPQIPWSSIIGMRHKVTHGYFDIDYDVVWKTVSVRLPELIVELEKIIPPETG